MTKTKIYIITYIEDGIGSRSYGDLIVSHGIEKEALKVIIMPQIPLRDLPNVMRDEDGDLFIWLEDDEEQYEE